MSKFVNLEQIKVLANKVKSEDAALGTKLETVTTKVDNLVAAGGEANILEGVKVNGAALAISDKMVDILIASGEENGHHLRQRRCCCHQGPGRSGLQVRDHRGRAGRGPESLYRR